MILIKSANSKKITSFFLLTEYNQYDSELLIRRRNFSDMCCLFRICLKLRYIYVPSENGSFREILIALITIFAPDHVVPFWDICPPNLLLYIINITN